MSEPTDLTRRRLLGNSAKLAAAAFTSTLLPPNVRRALAATPLTDGPTGSLRDVKHVVLLMQENRSFDHYFGTLAGVRGFNDPGAMLLRHGKSVFFQPDEKNPDGFLLPFHLDTKSTNAQKVPSTSHSWGTQHECWNNGKMDKWLKAHNKADGAHGSFCMGYFKRDDIPFQYALAEAFTICDGYHCSVLGPTWPNRLYWMTGCIDAAGRNGGPVISNKDTGYTWTTYAERLEAAGVSWKVYNSPDSHYDDAALSDTPSKNFPFNMLGHFRNFIESPAGSPLRTKALTLNNGEEFAKDCANDNLPTVSWLMPPRHASEHPDHMPAAGADFVAKTIDAIAANPKVWAKTAFILNYDENDGIFDHVAPPTPPRGTPLEFVNGEPIGGGFRVPCIIVSPWTAGGWVCSQRFDHTSILQFCEKLTGVRELNITNWRRQTFGDLTAAFRFNSPSTTIPKLPDAAAQYALAESEVKHLPFPEVPRKNQIRPIQERGIRKRTPNKDV
ncbi:MAG TPA: alkaline phosphatase family protein [Tepidisphaeraceae bacterium]|jgi:phospholipase C|nr:alkaline phosphatase family protein [Tepidisphaeraceae bacterium]